MRRKGNFHKAPPGLSEQPASEQLGDWLVSGARRSATRPRDIQRVWLCNTLDPHRASDGTSVSFLPGHEDYPENRKGRFKRMVKATLKITLITSQDRHPGPTRT